MTAASPRMADLLQGLERGILALLLALGVLVVVVFLARLLAVVRSGGDFEGWKKKLLKGMDSEIETLPRTSSDDERTVAGRIMIMGLSNGRLPPEAMEKLFEVQASEDKGRLERGIPFLGTVGASAPFLGLAGTVVGILTAFGKLADAGGRENSEVLASISNALIATLVGLIVAIPAVVFHNILRIRIKSIQERSSELRNLFLVRGLRSVYSKAES